jgi:hypothetical protein
MPERCTPERCIPERCTSERYIPIVKMYAWKMHA